MTKKQLIEIAVIKTALDKRELEEALNTFIATIKNEIIAKKEVTIRGFGTFGNKKRKAKVCNFESMKGTIIEEAYVPIFKPSKELKDKINKLP